MLNKDAVIQAVVKKHGILLSKDDPILSFLAVHDVVLDLYSEKMAVPVNAIQEQLEEITDKHYLQSKDLAEKIVGSAVTSIKNEGEALEENIRQLLNVHKNEYEQAMEKHKEMVVASQKLNNQITITTVAVAVITLAALAILLL